MKKTEHLVIRPFQNSPTDLAALYAILADKDVNRFLPWWPIQSLAAARDFYQKRIAPNSESQWYAICLRDDDTPIGYVTIGKGPSRDLGYGLRKAYWGQGITTEAAGAVVTELRAQQLPFITATHDVNNHASGKVMQRLGGMQYQYSYREQWQPKDILVTFRMYQLNLAQTDALVYREYWDKYPNHFIEQF